MNFKTMFGLLAVFVLLPALAFAQELGAVPSPIELMGQGEGIFGLLKNKEYLLAVGPAISFLIGLSRKIVIGGSSLWDKVPKRLRVLIPMVAGAVAGCLGDVTVGVMWKDAVMGALFIGPQALATRELFWKSALGKVKE